MILQGQMLVDAAVITLANEPGLAPLIVLAVDPRPGRIGFAEGSCNGQSLQEAQALSSLYSMSTLANCASVDELATVAWGWIASDGETEELHLDAQTKRRLTNQLLDPAGLAVYEINEFFLPGQSQGPAPFVTLHAILKAHP